MHRLPVRSRKPGLRLKSSSSFIRNTFIEYFVENGHKHVKSSSVVPIHDSTVPFVNAGMNQFKGVFLGKVDPPCPRAVNSQKCVRVGGKHNDLEIVGTDGHHHTFFEMLGNWSFGDYYKKEACQMAWDLLLGPYRLKPENLVVTYFSGDALIGLKEDRECRDIWKDIGVAPDRIKPLGAADNFWEMGATGPCGPCTEIHHVNPDGTLTEIWNIVFIQCDRQANGSVKPLPRHNVDTGMGLERMAALLQGVPSNYDTDLFQPIIRAIEKYSKGVTPYAGRYGADAKLDAAYRRIADHARMISICLADGVFPATSLNLKQIMRKTFKTSTDVFHNPRLLHLLYPEVVDTLGDTYPELGAKAADAKLVIEHEEQSYARMKAELKKKWNNLASVYPEIITMEDVEMSGFAAGYKEFKEMMAKQGSNIIPGELVFKLYDTYGFQEDIIERIGTINNLEIDKKGFENLLIQHKARHKIVLKEQTSKTGHLFNKCIDNLLKSGYKSTNDQYKYDYIIENNEITFKTHKSKLIAILNQDTEWIDVLDPCENKPYYLVVQDTNFYCEEGGQVADSGVIRLNNGVNFNVDSVFKIRDFIFHKGHFSLDSCSGKCYVKVNSEVELKIDDSRRVKVMRNHTGVHLLNAAIRKVLPNSVVCPIGSKVTDKGLYLNLSVYGQKLSQKVVLEAQELIRESIKSNVPVDTRQVDSVEVSKEPSVVTIPGETYPEVGLRLVTVPEPLVSKELCCGTHVPYTSFLEQFCVTLVKGAGGHTPAIHALTGGDARQVRELFSRAQKLEQVIELVDPENRKEECTNIKRGLAQLCGSSGAPFGEYGACIQLLEGLMKRPVDRKDMALHAIAETEIRETMQQAKMEGRRFVVHFLRCSYLMQLAGLARALRASDPSAPLMLLGCAGGLVVAATSVPQDMVTSQLTAQRWLACILPIFHADVLPAAPGNSPLTYAEMTATKVSLINCEQLVQDAMRVAIKFGQAHIQDTEQGGNGERTSRQQN